MSTKHDSEAQPIFGQPSHETQAYGTITRYPLGLNEDVCARCVAGLNQILADTIVLRDLYKKCHWQVSGPTFYSLHLLFDKHADEQTRLVDSLAERIQVLGGVALAMSRDVVETSRVKFPLRGREDVPGQLSRLLEVHEQILIEARALAREAAALGDDGTNDLLVSEIVRTSEVQVWFVAGHLVDTPLAPVSAKRGIR